jgi:hypothetical protein
MIKKPLIIAILTFTVLSGYTVAYASTGTFTIYPSHTHNGNRNWIIRQASPGNTIEESLTLENLSGRPQQISIELKEAREENGKFTPVNDGPYENIGNWIKLPGTLYTLAPYEKVKIPFELAVPDNTGPRGYDAAVFAVKKDINENGIDIVTQIGVRVYLDVVPGNSGLTDIFSAYGFKNSLFFLLSMAGVSASVLYYLINHFETKKHGQRQA